MKKELQETELYAWIGEDEMGSGVVGLKQCLAPAGFIPMVATDIAKMTQPYIKEQLQGQANRYRKTIYLMRYIPEIVEVVIKPGVPTRVHVEGAPEGVSTE
jgi:hypothetical protein